MTYTPGETAGLPAHALERLETMAGKRRQSAVVYQRSER